MAHFSAHGSKVSCEVSPGGNWEAVRCSTHGNRMIKRVWQFCASSRSEREKEGESKIKMTHYFLSNFQHMREGKRETGTTCKKSDGEVKRIRFSLSDQLPNMKLASWVSASHESRCLRFALLPTERLFLLTFNEVTKPPIKLWQETSR